MSTLPNNKPSSHSKSWISEDDSSIINSINHFSKASIGDYKFVFIQSKKNSELIVVSTQSNSSQNNQNDNKFKILKNSNKILDTCSKRKINFQWNKKWIKLIKNNSSI